MQNINNLDYANKYIQGSIWHWNNTAEKREGVQSGQRPVLIISNNTFNHHSPVVNCVCITSQLKDSPVHVPLFLDRESHVLCEQIHTIPKRELAEYMGTAPNSILLSIKAKLRFQFDMSADKNTEMFNSIKKSIDGLNTNPDIMNSIKENLALLNEKADKGFGVPDIENDFLRLILNLENNIGKIIKDVDELKSAYGKEPPKNDIVSSQSENSGAAPDSSQQTVLKGKRRNYTYEDKLFIADKNNSIETLMKKYGYSRTIAHKMRNYFKNRIGDISGGDLDNENSGGQKSGKRKNSRYSDEDIKFILDTNNSPDALVAKYNLKNKQSAYYLRKNMKTNINKKM